MHFKSLEDIVIIIIIIYHDKNYIKLNQETSTSTIGAKSSCLPDTLFSFFFFFCFLFFFFWIGSSNHLVIVIGMKT